jgi:hypothetical protein
MVGEGSVAMERRHLWMGSSPYRAVPRDEDVELAAILNGAGGYVAAAAAHRRRVRRAFGVLGAVCLLAPLLGQAAEILAMHPLAPEPTPDVGRRVDEPAVPAPRTWVEAYAVPETAKSTTDSCAPFDPYDPLVTESLLRLCAAPTTPDQRQRCCPPRHPID